MSSAAHPRMLSQWPVLWEVMFAANVVPGLVMMDFWKTTSKRKG